MADIKSAEDRSRNMRAIRSRDTKPELYLRKLLFAEGLRYRILFTCMDGTIRDLAALRGTYRIIPETTDAISMLLDVLLEAGTESIHILLDEPVSNSGRLKALIADIGEKYPFTLDIQIRKDVDRELYGKENVITSDSVILDNCKSWINLTFKCLEKHDGHALKVW